MKINWLGKVFREKFLRKVIWKHSLCPEILSLQMGTLKEYSKLFLSILKNQRHWYKISSELRIREVVKMAARENSNTTIQVAQICKTMRAVLEKRSH